MNLQIALNVAGGLALFLLAMRMMTEGLKVFAGSGLKDLLGRWTSTPLRGVLSGLLVTGIVQSSSAVTVATIGFVNAGVLTLRQSLGVIFGANVGTTMTAWLVSLIGFGFKIDAIALPILAVGVALQLMAPRKRYQGLGEALAGFALFFLGLAILKEAFGGLAEGYSVGMLAEGAPAHWFFFLLAGVAGSVLTQSSSAAVAIVITAVAGGVIGIESAAAAVIGASLGTTSTAAVAVFKATPSAKRLALGHILFNVIAASVALLLFPGLLWLVGGLGAWLDFEGGPAVTVALFHTVYKALGVAIMLPLAGRLADLLERMFRSEAEELARPQHLDATLAATPVLAALALREELLGVRAIVARIVHSALGDTLISVRAVEREASAVRTLGEAITAFVTSVRTETMPQEVAVDLARGLRIARYLDEAARLAPQAERLRREAAMLSDESTRSVADALLSAATHCAALAGSGQAPADTGVDDETGVLDAVVGGDPARAEALERFQRAYQAIKTSLLHAAVDRRLSVETTDGLLDAASATRRLVEQLVKADRLLRTPAQSVRIEAESDAAAAEEAPTAPA